MKNRFGFGVLSAALLCGCGFAPSEPKANKAIEKEPKLRSYKLETLVGKVGPRRISVDVTTDLPNGTNLLVTVRRSYWERKDKESEYAGEIYSEDLPVKDGKVSVDVDVVDSIWVKAHAEKKDQFTPLGLWDEIGEVSPKIEVWVLYSSMRDQPDSVQKILGAKGELVLQPSTAVDGMLTTLEAREEVILPFKQ